MREEILRMDRVTYQDGGVTELHQFCLDVYAGDIPGQRYGARQPAAAAAAEPSAALRQRLLPGPPGEPMAAGRPEL